MSFPSILTSTYPLMYPYIRENNLFMSDERTSFVEILKRNGYKTSAFHSNPHLSTYFGYGKGFDLFEDHILSNENCFISKIKSKVESKYSERNTTEENSSEAGKLVALIKKHIAVERKSFETLAEKKRLQRRIRELRMKMST